MRTTTSWTLVAHLTGFAVAFRVVICRPEGLVRSSLSSELPAFRNMLSFHISNRSEHAWVSALEPQLIITTPRYQLEVPIIDVVVTRTSQFGLKARVHLPLHT